MFEIFFVRSKNLFSYSERITQIGSRKLFLLTRDGLKNSVCRTQSLKF